MDSAYWAEWVVARFTDQSRAEAIVGDLLEDNQEAGTLQFWLSVGVILISVTRRRVVALVAAYFCFCWLRSLPMPVNGAVYVFFRGMSSSRHPSEDWWRIVSAISSLGMLLWMAVPYALFRYGPNDRFAQLALAFGTPITAFIFFWWIPAVAITSLALTAAVLAFSIAFAQARVALPHLAIALAVGSLARQLTIFAGMAYLQLASPSAFRSSLVFDLEPLMVLLMLSLACNKTSRSLLLSRERTHLLERTP
jgi:hypothetical protein